MSIYCPKGHWENGMTLPCKQCQIEQLRVENERLNKQINSYKMLTKSLEETKTYLLKKADQNKEAVETLASEREANAALTGENEELKRKLDAALAACEAKDARFKQIVRMANHLDVLSIAMQAHDALAIKPDDSSIKAHDEALIERCAEVCEEHQGSVETCAAAIRELKGTNL